MRIAVLVSVGTKIGTKQVPTSYYSRKKDGISPMFLRSNRSKLYRSYIEEISKLYRRKELSGIYLVSSWIFVGSCA
jgi:hypothetical protein